MSSARSAAATRVFWGAFLLVAYAFLRILWPFFSAIAWAVILATVCFPVFRRLSRWLRGRRHLAAFLSCVLICAVIIVPFCLLVILLAKESVEAYASLQAVVSSPTFESRVRWNEYLIRMRLADWLSQFAQVEAATLESWFVGAIGSVSAFLVSQSRQLLTGFAGFVFHLFTMLVTVYFCFLDGPELLRQCRQLLPVPPRYAERVIRRFQEVSSATIYGSLLTALAQGLAGALVFAVLGARSPLLWGAAMGAASFLPLVGTGLIWVPAALYYMVTGDMPRGVALLALGLLFISMIDNIVKPLVIQGRMGLHILLVFFSILGGLKVFGFLGIVLGPLIAALFQTFLTLYRAETGRAAPPARP